MTKRSEFFAKLLDVNKDEVELIVQIGTGNTRQTSCLEVRSFNRHALVGLITKGVNYFRIVTSIQKGSIKVDFIRVEETEELKSLFIKPDYFS